MALKLEEKLRKKGNSSSKKRGTGKDFKGGSRGGASGGRNDQRSYDDSKWNKKNNENSQRGYNRGRGSNSGGSARGSHFSNMKFYNCNKLGNLTYNFPNKASGYYVRRR